METFKIILSALALLGMPTIFGMICWCVKICKDYGKKQVIIMRAIQAQMRSELLQQYYSAKERGYISSEDLDEWENRYQSYHALGQNGVLDKRREELFKLPTSLEEWGD